MIIWFTLNDDSITIDTDPEFLLVDLLRKEFGLGGARPGCRRGRCGTCAILFNGHVTSSCMLPAFKALGSEIVTIEGFMKTPDFADIERGFQRAGMDPCRFCAAAKVLVTHGLIQHNSSPRAEDIERAANGVFCRCTSYSSFVDAIRYAAEARRKRSNVGRVS